jgi:uncharacterized membrane protein YedE/YeeE
MHIDWNGFTPWMSLAGGALIGLAATILILFNGRIAGISGIVGGLLSGMLTGRDAGWRLMFVLGLLLAPVLYGVLSRLPEIRIDTGYPLLIVAGLLVGFGARLGSGCTSGHGVCGLSRLSPRSLAATLSFMAAGFVTVYVLRHLLGA